MRNHTSMYNPRKPSSVSMKVAKDEDILSPAKKAFNSFKLMNYSTLKINFLLSTFYFLLSTFYFLLSTFYFLLSTTYLYLLILTYTYLYLLILTYTYLYLLILTYTYLYLLILTYTYFKFLLFKPANVSKYLFSLEFKLNSIICNHSFFLQNYPILYLISARIPQKQVITSLSLPLFETALQMNNTTAFLLTLKSPIVFLYISSV
jgi:hypothetical protein